MLLLLFFLLLFDSIFFSPLFLLVNDFSNPSISLPSLRGRGRGWGFWGIGFVGLCWALSYLEHKRSDEVVADDTGEIAHESDPCDLLHVPSEGDLLQTHNHYSGCATYDEH